MIEISLHPSAVMTVRILFPPTNGLFSAIILPPLAGAGPLIGPVLAAQYGWGPGFFWILLGSVFAGSVHDMIILFASYRHNGQSLSVIAERDVSKLTGGVTAVVILFIIIVALAGLGVAIVNSLFNNPWGASPFP